MNNSYSTKLSNTNNNPKQYSHLSIEEIDLLSEYIDKNPDEEVVIKEEPENSV